MGRNRWIFPVFALLAGSTSAPGEAWAAPPARTAAPQPRPGARRTAVKGRVGIPYARQLLDSDQPGDRIRGIVRLGAIGTQEAIDALVDAMEQGAAVVRDPRARLEAVRVLAPHAKRETVRQILLRETNDAGTSEARGSFSPLAGVIRGTAALALARSGEKKAVVGLLNALSQAGAPAEAATRALRAYPPASLESFLEGRKRLTPQLATFLGELGDLRAQGRLRLLLEESDPGGKTAAVVALAKLGDDAALAPAREWLKSSEPRLRRAAAEVLHYLGAPDAGVAIAGLLTNDATREVGLRLAMASAAPELAAPLAATVALLPEETQPTAVAAIGRAGGAKAVAALVPLLAKPELATHAAHALSRVPDDAARVAIEKAMGAATDGPRRRLAVRAAIARALGLGDAPRGLGDALEALFVSREPADRALGVFGLVATGSWSVERALERSCEKGRECGPHLVAAAARGALARDVEELESLVPVLVQADQSQRRATIEAAGAALLAMPGGGPIPTSHLADWAEAGGSLAPLAARALPSRDSPELRGRIKRLLEGSDPLVRAHLALGLGEGPEPDAVTLLTNAYRYEDDPSVRRAIVRALAKRTEIQRHATLVLARDLDPDDAVRSLARAAIDGRPVDVEPFAGTSGAAPRRQVAWIALVSTSKAAAPVHAARVVRSDGLAVPVVADPDGVMLVPGMPPGGASLLLAPPASPGDAQRR